MRGIGRENIEYMYCGVTTISQDCLKDFLKVAKELEVKELSDKETNDHKVKAEITDDFNEESSEAFGKEFNGGFQYPEKTKTVCPDCGKVFTQRDSLSRHRKAAHRGVRFPCSECDYKASRREHLNYHIKSKHGM